MTAEAIFIGQFAYTSIDSRIVITIKSWRSLCLNQQNHTSNETSIVINRINKFFISSVFCIRMLNDELNDESMYAIVDWHIDQSV